MLAPGFCREGYLSTEVNGNFGTVGQRVTPAAVNNASLVVVVGVDPRGFAID
jgi:hypothetical protein